MNKFELGSAPKEKSGLSTERESGAMNPQTLEPLIEQSEVAFLVTDRNILEMLDGNASSEKFTLDALRDAVKDIPLGTSASNKARLDVARAVFLRRALLIDEKLKSAREELGEVPANSYSAEDTSAQYQRIIDNRTAEITEMAENLYL